MLEPPNIRAIPAASDAGAAERGLEDWRAATGGALLDDEVGIAVLTALFGNAPFLGQCALHHPESLIDTLQMGPGGALAALTRSVGEQALAARTDEARTMAVLRQARRQAALIIGTADVALGWSGPRVTAALSRFAASALRHGVDHLLATAAAAGELEPADPAHPSHGSGFVVLGMGKLGGGELNYSSDVDLIVLYDPDITPYRGRRELPDFFVRLTRKLAGLLESPTGDGYVCRVDLRLRPDPSATPPAISLPAAEGYYASLGQNWERAAMIKARPVAGDGAAGTAFLHTLRPFMWRKHLDFAAIQDIHSIKRQIHAHKGGGEVAVNGHNVKLGAGGIREIEFFAQTQQLIWGGRYQSLRVRRTEAALHALHALERVTDVEMHELIESYWYLRRVEHRLQMVNDQQTHVLPEDDEGLARIATFLGYDDLGAFAAHLRGHLERVSGHCGRLFGDAPGLAAPDAVGGNLVFTSGDHDPGTMETLTRMGFRNPGAVSSAIRAWHHGRIRATRSTRSRELLTELVPSMLGAFARAADPDQAFARFDGFLANLPSGVQLFSLFQAAPKLLDLVAEITGAAPRIADYLARHADVFDAVLAQGFYDDLPDKAALRETLDHELSLANDFQDRLDIARKWAGDTKFQVSVQQLLALRDTTASAPSLTAVADVLIEAMLAAVEDEFALRHGRMSGGALAVVGYGKLGSGMLARGSDLDMVFVYRSPGTNAESDGERPLSAPVYYARLCQRLITALSAQTGGGLLYEVDTRLRPMGEDGPLASEVEGFVRYYREDAWTWEQMALTRARVVLAPDGLRSEIEAVITMVLGRERDPGALASEVRDMRERIAREHGGDDIFAVKHVRGGLMDVEFIVQYLVLRDACRHPAVMRTNTLDALAALAEAGSMASEVAHGLAAAARLFYDVQAMMRLALSGDFDRDSAPGGMRRALCRAADAVDFAALEAKLRQAQAEVRSHFAEIVEAAATPENKDQEKMR